MSTEPLKEIREGIADAKGIALFGEYTEAEAAGFLAVHPRTLAQIRREGRIVFVRKGPRNIRYLGLHIADFIIASIEQSEASPAARAPASRPKSTSPAMRVSAVDLAQKTFGRLSAP